MAGAGLRLRLERFLPRRPPSGEWVGYAVYTFALFLLFLVLTFPHEIVARRILNDIARTSGWMIDFREVSLVPWSGYRFRNLRVRGPDGPGDTFFQAARIGVRPSIVSLLRGNVSDVSFSGEAYGGTVGGSASWNGGLDLDLQWSRLDLSHYPRLADLAQGTWEGRLSGSLELNGQDSIRTVEGTGRLSLESAALTDGNVRGFKVPDLHFADGLCEFELKGGRLEVKTLRLAGSEVDVEMRGQLYLREPIQQSVVNANLSVRPLPGAPQGVEGLLMMLKGNQRSSTGTYSYAVYGSLSQMRLR